MCTGGTWLAASALTLVNLTTGATVDPAMMSLSYNPATKTGTWTFPGLTATGGRLSDGNYRATLAAPAIASLAGVPMAADYSYGFLVLIGDLNPQQPVYPSGPRHPKSGGTTDTA